jgi:hypothetical protein
LMVIMQFENGNYLFFFFFQGPRESKCSVDAGYYSVKLLMLLFASL